MLHSWLGGLTLSGFQGIQLGGKLTFTLLAASEQSLCEFSDCESEGLPRAPRRGESQHSVGKRKKNFPNPPAFHHYPDSQGAGGNAVNSAEASRQKA